MRPNLCKLVDDAHDAGYEIIPMNGRIFIEKARQYTRKSNGKTVLGKRVVTRGVLVYVDNGTFVVAHATEVPIECARRLRSVAEVRRVLDI